MLLHPHDAKNDNEGISDHIPNSQDNSAASSRRQWIAVNKGEASQKKNFLSELSTSRAMDDWGNLLQYSCRSFPTVA